MSRWDDLAAAAGLEDRDVIETFRRKRYTPNGGYRFLWLIYSMSHWNAGRGQEDWLRRYQRAQWISEVCRKARIRLPGYVSRMERARARESLAEYKRRVPARARPPEFKKAERWSARD
jgi:hypothetical protein